MYVQGVLPKKRALDVQAPDIRLTAGRPAFTPLEQRSLAKEED